MSVAKITRDFVTNIEGAKLFTYDDIPCLNKTSAAIELSRLFKKGIIKKVSKGKFYKPKIRVFGEVAPNTNDKIKSLGWEPAFNFKSGIEHTINWYFTNQWVYR